MAITFHRGIFTAVTGLAGAGAIMIWPDKLWIGYALIVSSLFLILWGVRFNGWGLADWVKGRNHRIKIFRERDSYKNEVIDLRTFVENGGFVTGKTFNKCILHYPKIKFQARCSLNFCSISNSSWNVLKEGAPIENVLLFVDCNFTQCLFDRCLIIGTHKDYMELGSSIDETSIRNWKAKL